MTPVADPPVSPYRSYRKDLLAKDQVRAFSTLRPAVAVRDAAWCWAGIVAAWTLVAYCPTWWAVLIALPVIGTRYHGLYIIGHDGLHRRVFESERWNDWFTDLFVLGPIGAITRINNRNHLTHHRHLCTPADPDRHKHGTAGKTTRSAVLGYLTGLTSAVRSAANVFLRRGAAPVSAQPTRPAGYTVRDLAIVLGWQAALFGGLTWAIGWWAYPVLWWLPVYTFTFLGDNFRTFCEHSQPEPDDLADRHRLITFDSHPLERLFVAPMNMNYHAVHHLWPSVPYYNLPAADRATRDLPAAGRL
ncbi:MAG TPA: fatty acid desaturase [Fimbriiglobus sp.]|nr:fatty acid desaturase [Fimbriiglobus sp.]